MEEQAAVDHSRVNSDAKEAGRSRWRLLGMSWAHFCNDGASNFLPGVLPAILISLQLPVAWAGVLMTALLVGQGLQPFVGLLGDRIGGRGLSVLGLLGSSLGAGLVGLAHGPVMLIIVLVLIGWSNAFFHPQAVAGVRQLSTARQGLSMSVFLVGGEFGRGIWPVLATWCVALGGLPWLAILALPGLVTTVLLYRVAPALPARGHAATPIAWSEHWAPLARLVAYCGLRAFMTFAMAMLLPIMWAQEGGGLSTGASLITVMMVVGVVGNLAGGWLSEHLGARALLLAAMLISGVSAMALGFSSGPWLWLLTAILGIGLFATLPITVLLVQDQLPENRSFGSGLALGLANALGALAVIGIGPVINYAGLEASFGLVAFAALLACCIVPWIPQHDRSTPD